MMFRYTLSRPVTTINSMPSWDDLGGTHPWTIGVNTSVDLDGSQVSNMLVDDIANPYLGTYNFLIDASGTNNGGSGNTAQITFYTLDENEDIISSDGPVTIPNSDLVGYEFAFEATGARPHYIGIKVNNLGGDGNTVTVDLTYVPPTSSVVISEPDGWEGAKIKWERDPSFFSLIEYYEGSANGAFIFYGKNEDEGIDGGIEFIRSAESDFGFDANVVFLVEWSDDDINYTTLFSGLLDISEKVEMEDNKMQVPVIRDDLWAKFVNRFESPVNVSGTVDLDGNTVDALQAVTIALPSQKLRRTYHAHVSDSGISYPQFTSGTYYMIDFNDVVILDEIEERYTLPRLDNTELPASNFTILEGGFYNFDIRIIGSHTDPGDLFAHSLKTPDDYIDYYIQFGNQSPIAFDWVDEGVGDGAHTIFTFSGTYELQASTQIRIYGIANITSSNDLNILGGDSTGFPGSSEFASYCKIIGDTIFPATEAQAYLIHDLIHAVLVRIGLGPNPLYSEFLGHSTNTNRQYDFDGCGWMYAIIKGLQLRGYTLTEKPFFISMKQIWGGINPILNLGLGYEEIEGDQVIRIEEKGHFIGDTPPVNFVNVRGITSEYDKSLIFKTIRTGYKKWQSEEASGLDDPQAKHAYNTIIVKTGIDLNLESDFIAAGLAIEVTRRKTKKLSADYKFDNDNFIISLNSDDVSPDFYSPELDENFSSVTGLLNSNTRYNLILTPMRNLLRWGNYLVGCLQSYLHSSFKFDSGEGNFDMTSTSEDPCTRGVLEDSLSEDDDINLMIANVMMSTYSPRFTPLFLPILYTLPIPMEKEEYDLLDRKEPIGISQTDSGFANFHIKEMEYEVLKGQAIIKAWPEEFFDITVPEQEIVMRECDSDAPAEVVYDVDYQAVLDYAELQGYTTPSDAQKLIESNALTSMKAEGIWDDLDLFYHFETDGDENFAMINWKSPGTNNLTKNGTVTFTALQGFTGDGATGYLDTGWNPTDDGVNFTLDESGVFVKINNECTAGNLYQYGVSESSDQSIALAAKYTGGTTHRIGINSTTVSISSNGTSAGLFHIRRVADNDLRIYRDGVQVGSTSTQASTSMVIEQHLALLAFNANGTIAGHSNAQIGIFGIGASITGKESSLNTIFNS